MFPETSLEIEKKASEFLCCFNFFFLGGRDLHSADGNDKLGGNPPLDREFSALFLT